MRPGAAGMRIYTRWDYGALARLHVLDDRQYRDYQACPRPDRGGGSNVVPDWTIVGVVKDAKYSDLREAVPPVAELDFAPHCRHVDDRSASRARVLLESASLTRPALPATTGLSGGTYGAFSE